MILEDHRRSRVVGLGLRQVVKGLRTLLKGWTWRKWNIKGGNGPGLITGQMRVI